jgi:hypothetical protein
MCFVERKASKCTAVIEIGAINYTDKSENGSEMNMSNPSRL